MNLMLLTGILAFEPIYDEFQGKRRVQLTVRHHAPPTLPDRQLMQLCIWVDPPAKYWKTPAMVTGTLVYVDGPLVTVGNDRSTYLEVDFFRILKTAKAHEEFLERKSEQMKKLHRQKF